MIASYILKGPLQAMLSAAVPAVLSVAAPYLIKLFLVYFSGVAIALVSLRLGGRKGLEILLVTVFAVVIAGQWMSDGLFAQIDLWNSVYLWTLVWLSASAWQWSRSFVVALQVTGLVSIMTVIAYFVVIDDPFKLHMKLLEPFQQALMQPASGLTTAEVDKLIRWLASVFPGSVVAYTALGVMISLFIARSWQAKLFNPGAWKQEFSSVRFGQKTGLLSIGLIVLMLFSASLGEKTSLLLFNIAVVAGLVYIVVGLGLVHALLDPQKNGGFWLVGLYALLIMLSQLVAPILMTLALTDIWVDYRARLLNKSG